MKKILFIIMIFLLLIGCDNAGNTNINPDVSFEKDNEDMFTEKDYDNNYDVNSVIHIKLNNDSILCDSSNVKTEGSICTIYKDGVYIITGSLSNGYIIIDSKNSKPHIILDNACISNDNFAGIYVKEAEKIFITLAADSYNKICNKDGFNLIDENNVDAAIFSKSDLTINGDGNLEIISAGHGIVSKDDLVITGGKYNISSVGHGISANDSVRLDNADINIESNKDGIHAVNADDTNLGYIYISNGNFNIKASDDGICSGSNIQIENGCFDIYTGSSYTTENTSLKAIKATSSILINNGNFKIDSYDDSIHSNLSVIINGGQFDISTNDDGIHADETLEITNGVINIVDSYEGLEALNVSISGGDIHICSSDDGINAAGGNDVSGSNNPGMMGPGGRPGRPGDNFGSTSNKGKILISGGMISIMAKGDGIDANGNLEISGGIVHVCGPTTGDTAVLDYDGTGIISGGEFYGTGSRMMAQTLTSDNQGVISVSVGSINAGIAVVITDNSGNVVANVTPKLAYQIVIVSNSKIIKGDKYTITIGTNKADVIAQ